MIWYLSVLQNSQLPVNLSSNSGVLYEEDKKGHSFLSSFASLGPDFEKILLIILRSIHFRCTLRKVL